MPSNLPLWAAGLSVVAGIGWLSAFAMVAWDMTHQDKLPDTIVTIAAVAALAATLSAVAFGGMLAQRTVFLEALAAARNETPTVEIPAMHNSHFMVVPHPPRVFGTAAVAATEDDQVPMAEVRQLTKDAYRLARRSRPEEA
jgi:hypothetical protein